MSGPVKYTMESSHCNKDRENGQSSQSSVYKSATPPCDSQRNLPTTPDIQCYESNDSSSETGPSVLNSQTIWTAYMTDDQLWEFSCSESSNVSSVTNYPQQIASPSSQFDSPIKSNERCLMRNAFPTLCSPWIQRFSTESFSLNRYWDSQPAMFEYHSTTSSMDSSNSESTSMSNVDRALIHIGEGESTDEAFKVTGSVEHIRGWSLAKIESEIVQFKEEADIERANLVTRGERVDFELEILKHYINVSAEETAVIDKVLKKQYELLDRQEKHLLNAANEKEDQE